MFRGTVFVWATICFLFLQSSPPTLQESILARQSDESERSRDDRQRALTILLAAGNQFADEDPLKAARYFNRAGRLQLRLNSSSEAIATFQRALHLIKNNSDSNERIDLLNGLAMVFMSLSKCDEAKMYLEDAISSSEHRDYIAGHAEALLTLSRCQDFSDHALSIKTAQKSLELSESIGNRIGVAQAYSNLSEFQMLQSSIMEARESSEMALRIWRELNMPDEEAAALISIGFLEYRKGAWQTCLSFLMQAQSLIDEKAEPEKMGKINGGIAEAFIESGIPEVGLTKSREALENFRLADDPRGVTIMNWDIGKAYYMLGNYAEALKALQQAMNEAAALKNPFVIAICHDFLGRTYGASGDQTSGLQHFELALNLYTQIGNPREAARTRALMGQLYERQAKIEKARSFYQTALAEFNKLADRVNESAALYALGRLELKSNNLDLAENYLRQSIEVTENIRRVSTSGDLMAAFSATVHDRYESYIECLMRQSLAQTSKSLVVRAFETSELARSRSLAELLRTTQTVLVPGIDPQLAEREKSLRQALKVKEDSKVALLEKNYTKEELQSLEVELSTLEKDYQEIIQMIRARYPSYEQVTASTAWDLRQIQDQVIVDDQTLLLEYSLGLDRSYVWAVTKNELKSYELPPLNQINEAAQKVYQLLKTSNGSKNAYELAQATRALSQLILSPVAADLKRSRLIVIADGPLHYIPFQILTTAAAGDQPLVATTEIINSPSASILGQLRQEAFRKKSPTEVLAAFGDPVFASNYAQRRESDSSGYVAALQRPEDDRWRQALRDIDADGESLNPTQIQPLYYAKYELDSLQNVAGSEAFLASGFDATPEKLKNTDLTKYAILHFATHGILNPRRPEQSGLLLSTVNRDGRPQNGFVGLEDIYNLRAPVSLVVLSACQTGLGKDVRGEGLIGLTRGFMYAGASSVVSSLWKVDDEVTAELMKHFYANMLQRGMPPAAALRAAQNSIREQPQWRSPYYWAAFTFQGDYQQSIRLTSPTMIRDKRLIAVLISAMLLLALGGWLVYRRFGRVHSTVKK